MMERLLLIKTGCWLASSARCLIFARTSLLTIELGYNSKPHVFAIVLKCTFFRILYTKEYFISFRS